MEKMIHIYSYNDFVNEKKELSKLQIEYREYFKFMLKCYNVDSPTKLSDEKKSEFFDNVKKYWIKGKGASKDLEKIKKEICGEEK
jgi:hypothetical protein